MARNGSGTFTRVHDFTDDAAAAIKIRADRMDEEMDGIATALTASIANDGQTPILADLPMSTYKHTGVGNATARNQYATVASLQDGSHNWVAAGGTADAITATYAPALTALVDGQLCFVRAGAANATTTPTFAPNGLTAHTITKRGGTALGAGDIAAAGHELILRYNLANTRWELLNPAPGAVLTSSFTNQNISASPTHLASVSLTPGLWRISAIAVFNGTYGGTYFTAVISSTIDSSTNSWPTTPRIDSPINAAGVGDLAVPPYDLTIAATTTYYFNILGNGTATGGLNGTLRAERIG